MKLSEFLDITGINKKTAYWVYSKVHNDIDRCQKHRYFTQEDVNYVLSRKIENYPYRLKRIEDFPNYFVSEFGKVFTNKRNFLEEIEPYIYAGYRYVILHNNGIDKHYKISKLVALYFVENSMNKPIPNHIDGNKSNDVYTNLEWSTYSENTKHAYDNGLAYTDKGEDDSQSFPVDLYTNDGVFVRHFGSISEAARELGFHKSKIARQAKNESKGQDGFCFRYSNK